MSASYKGHRDVVELLLGRGANIHEEDDYGDTAIRMAIDEDHGDIVATLQRWPVTMWILVMQDLMVYHHLDCESTQDLLQYIGSEPDYL